MACVVRREVLPLIEQALGWETRLTVAGYTAPEVSLEQFREHPRITLRGRWRTSRRLYDSASHFRRADALLRQALPYKVHEAASFGIPVVATELLRRQLGWEDGSDLLRSMPAIRRHSRGRLCGCIAMRTLWQTLRDNALERVRTENDRAQYEAAIRRAAGGLSARDNDRWRRTPAPSRHAGK